MRRDRGGVFDILPRARVRLVTKRGKTSLPLCQCLVRVVRVFPRHFIWAARAAEKAVSLHARFQQHLRNLTTVSPARAA